MVNRPILDPAPKGKPCDWSLRAIKKEKIKRRIAEAVVRPTSWHNPNQKYIYHRGQGNGGTCTGQSSAMGLEHNYIKLTGDVPTPEQMKSIVRDVRDSLNSLVDKLPSHAISSECLYQMGRYLGKVTSPSGGEIRFVAKAARDYGWVLESQWHSDKERLHVWDYPPGSRKTEDGGLSPEESAAFASQHRIKGWAMVGSPDGDATYQEICDAIYDYGWVMCAIPIYTNFVEMAGEENPRYPRPNGEIDGFHAQICDGYTPEELDIEHSWYGWCGQHGTLPIEYYTFARDLCVWLVYIDDEEVKIGEDIHRTMTITSNVPSTTISVDGTIVGMSPQKVAVDVKVSHIIGAVADGYVPQSKTVDDSISEVSFVLEPSNPSQPTKSWLQLIGEILGQIFAKIKEKLKWT